MEITKLLTSYKVKETSTTLLFEGEVQFNGDSVIQSLNGLSIVNNKSWWRY